MLTGSSYFTLFRKLRMGGDGVSVRTLTGNLSLMVREEQACAYDPGGASRNVTIHVDDNVVGNWRAFYNSADADGENLVIKNSAGTTIATAGRGETVVVGYGGSTPAWTKLLQTDGTADVFAAANSWGGTQTFQNVIMGPSSELTIATGAVAATRSYHTVDTEADAASDDLDSITGGATGEVLFVRAESAARTVVLKHAIGADKIACPGGRDISLAEATDWALLEHNGTQWTVVASSTLADAISALVTENADVVIPVSHADTVSVSGTWTRSRTAQGLYRIRRTAAAASEVLAIEIPIARLRNSAGKGLKVTGAKLQYQVSTEVADDVTVAGVYVVMPADASAVAAATSLGAVTYDAAHDTAGERGAIAQHTMTVTFGTPAYLTDGFITLEITVDDTTGGGAVFDLFLVELLASETLVEAA